MHIICQISSMCWIPNCNVSLNPQIPNRKYWYKQTYLHIVVFTYKCVLGTHYLYMFFFIAQSIIKYRQISNMRRTFVGN